MAYYNLNRAAPIAGLILVLFSVLLNPSRTLAQVPEIDIQKTARITLGKSAAQPNQTALVPVYLVPPKSIPVGRVKFDVTFVSVNMKFEKVEPGPVIDAGNVRFNTSITPGKNENGVETSTLSIQAELTDQTAGGFPSGIIAYLSMRLSAEAQPAQITLRTSAAEANQVGTGEAIADVRSYDAQMEVQVEGFKPTAVCFFFSH